MENKIKFFSEEFFNNLGINYEYLEVTRKQENFFTIKIQTNESGKLIGTQGKNLDAITSVLKLILIKNIKTEDRIKFYLEVNDYIKTKDDRLKDFVISKIKILEENGEDIIMPLFTAYERKKIHDIVANYGRDDIFTKSIGEGKERRIHLCKLEKKLSIDMDSLGI